MGEVPTMDDKQEQVDCGTDSSTIKCEREKFWFIQIAIFVPFGALLAAYAPLIGIPFLAFGAFATLLSGHRTIIGIRASREGLTVVTLMGEERLDWRDVTVDRYLCFGADLDVNGRFGSYRWLPGCRKRHRDAVRLLELYSRDAHQYSR